MSAPRAEVEAKLRRPTEGLTACPCAHSEGHVLECGVWVDVTTFPSSPVDVGRDTVETMRSMVMGMTEKK